MAYKAEYDLETHTAVWDPVLIGLGVFAGVGVLFSVMFAVFVLSGSPAPKSTREWQRKYYELACSSRGLELNSRNGDLKLCMDPKTKALYEID